MIRTLCAVFLLAHALLTGVMWLVPFGADAPFDPSHSWLFGDHRAVAGSLAVATAAGCAAAGIGLLAHQDWWSVAAILGGGLGAALMILCFTWWLSAGLLISLAIAVAGVVARTG